MNPVHGSEYCQAETVYPLCGREEGTGTGRRIMRTAELEQAERRANSTDQLQQLKAEVGELKSAGAAEADQLRDELEQAY